MSKKKLASSKSKANLNADFITDLKNIVSTARNMSFRAANLMQVALEISENFIKCSVSCKFSRHCLLNSKMRFSKFSRHCLLNQCNRQSDSLICLINNK